MRNIQHKKEAYWFYRFLSVFYDNYVNPLFWTSKMREDALELVELNSPDLLTLEAGSGTGFTTLGIIQNIPPTNIFCIDQSPHQMAKAKKKEELEGCNFQIGDAEDLAFPDNHFDRYVSAGSIEYWPNPQIGVSEAFRVLKPGGVALIIGPLHPKNSFAKTIADSWMLFPEESDYFSWFKNAGFQEIKTKYVRPDWVQSEKYGIAISGVKPDRLKKSTRTKASKINDVEAPTILRTITLIKRLIVGSLAGFLFIPIALWGYLRKSLKTVFQTEAELGDSHRSSHHEK